MQRLLDFMAGSAAGGLVLMGSAAAALVVANSPFAASYEAALAAPLGPLSALEWINDALMAVFFTLVGLEIKREMVDGELATNRLRVLPGLGALGGMAVPALIYWLINRGDAAASQGWAIPSATDIAFALGVAALLGPRVPASLKAFLAALAILDDLGAVTIIAAFYTPHLSMPYLVASLGVVGAMVALNRWGVRRLLPYLALGLVLWLLVHASGIHATLAGVAMAVCIPLSDSQGRRPSDGDCTHSPLLRLEHALHRVVPLTVLPLFGFANAGVSFAGVAHDAWTAPTTLGVALGLALGKVVGVFGAAYGAVAMGWAAMPRGATAAQLLATALLCGIGFTMSLFIGALAFPEHPALQADAKLGILMGSVVAALLGTIAFRWVSPPP